jgi:hypothetical protein
LVATIGCGRQHSWDCGVKHAGTAWGIVGWLLLVAWLPVIVEVCCNYLFRVEERFPTTILVIPYMEFITAPLTRLAALLVLYKGLRSALHLLRHKDNSN